MPSLRDTRRHIQSVESINKLTKAMAVVSMARSHRLRSLVENCRGFAVMSWQVLVRTVMSAENDVREMPLFRGYGSQSRLGLALITSDRGMVGPYNHNIVQFVSDYLQRRQQELPEFEAHLITIGRIGRERLLETHAMPHVRLHADIASPSSGDGIASFTPIARLLLDGFAQGTFDHIAIAYTQPRNGALVQAKIRQLLPLCNIMQVKAEMLPVGIEAARDQQEHLVASTEYIYEPSPRDLLKTLLPRVIRCQIYKAYLESLVAENASRTVAMRSATKNGDQLIARLRLTYNKVRQETITSDLLDIIGGSVSPVAG